MRPYAQYGTSKRTASLTVVSISDENISDNVADPSDALVSIHYDADGTLYGVGNDATIADGTWRSGGVSADYEIRVTPTIGTFSSGSESVSTWLSLGTTRSWRVTRTTFGTKGCSATVEIREAVSPFTVLDTAFISLTASVES
jgi:hypothetical protein